jgi:hypothetical protein
LLQALPFQIRKFFDQPFHLFLVPDGFPDARFPLPRHKQLVKLSALAANQVQASMRLAVGTAAVALPAADVAYGKGAAEETGRVNDLREPRTASPLTIRELRTLHGASFTYI